MHPDYGRFEMPGLVRSIGNRRDHLPAADVDFIFQRQNDRLGRMRLNQIALPGVDRTNARAPPRRKRNYFVTGPHPACCDLACKATEVLVRPKHALHRKAKPGACDRSMASGTVSSNSSRLGPLYQGMRLLR